ncbi:MAG: ABC transporter permease [Sphingobacterium hotanense]
MKKTDQRAPLFNVGTLLGPHHIWRDSDSAQQPKAPIFTLVGKEISTAIRSWKFIILVGLISLIFVGSTYVSLMAIAKFRDAASGENFHLYLKLFTASEQSIPPFYVFLNFLAPLLGIALGFDAINAERNNGTLIPLLSQPIYRDNVLLSKFFGPLSVVSVLFLSITLLMLGTVMLLTGVAVSPAEFIRILLFVLVSILYVGFWLSLSILCSIIFTQPSTSAMAGIGCWLFFSVFYPMLVSLLMSFLVGNPANFSEQQYLHYADFALNLSRISPSQLYNDATAALLTPSIRSLGPMSLEQSYGALPTDLTIGNSLSVIFPQLSGLVASTVILFAGCYFLFMRKEIRV